MPTERPLIPADEPEWIAILKQEVAKPGRTITSIAAEIDMSRPALSMLLSGSYPARLDKISRRYSGTVLGLSRGQVACPHLRRGITQAECQRHAGAPMSTSNPDKLRQWRACQRCPLSPFNTAEEAAGLQASTGA